MSTETTVIATNSKTVFIPWTNTDCTEGKGQQYPLEVCQLLATAIRKGHQRFVQGLNCPVTEETAYMIDGHWYAPVIIHGPTARDRGEQVRLDKLEKIKERCYARGLSENDVKYLMQNGGDND